MDAEADAEAGDITRLVSRWSQGDDEALDQLVALVYDDLRHIARRHLRLGERDPVLDTGVLVHEVYIKVARVQEGAWPTRAHFFAFCSTVMRRFLMDFARERQAKKRGGTRVQVPLSDDLAAVDAQVLDVLAVEDAINRLEQRSPRMARIVECRFFGGMSVAETAEALETSPRTVEREWARARAYLMSALGEGSAPDPD